MSRDLYEAPEVSAIKVAVSSLIDLGAISPPTSASAIVSGELTRRRLPSPDLRPLGELMFELPLDPALCKLVLTYPSEQQPQSDSTFFSCDEMIMMVSMLAATKNVIDFSGWFGCLGCLDY